MLAFEKPIGTNNTLAICDSSSSKLIKKWMRSKTKMKNRQMKVFREEPVGHG